MSAHAYTEDQLVEQPAIGLFAELGWTTVSALRFHPTRDPAIAGLPRLLSGQVAVGVGGCQRARPMAECGHEDVG